MRRYSLCVSIVLMLPHAMAAQAITQQQADEILKELRAIRQGIEALQRPSPLPAPARPSDGRVRLSSFAAEHTLGRTDAPLTVVEFTDLQCPFCSRFATGTFDELKKLYIDTGKARFISRDFPLTSIHPLAQRAAVASRCAGEQDKFWEMRSHLVRNASVLTVPFIATAGRELKLDTRAFEKCLDSGRFDAAIQRDIADAVAVGITGTPTFVIGRTVEGVVEGWKVIGALPFDAFDARLKQVLAESATPAPTAK